MDHLSTPIKRHDSYRDLLTGASVVIFVRDPEIIAQQIDDLWFAVVTRFSYRALLKGAQASPGIFSGVTMA
jgi:hypothetical protein